MFEALGVFAGRLNDSTRASAAALSCGESTLPVLTEDQGAQQSSVAGRAILILTPIALMLAKGLSRNLDHDENQFVASAYLLAHGGLLPYSDYPYFHTPYLIFVYAGLFRWTGHLLMAARLCSVCGGLASYCIILFCAARSVQGKKPARWLIYNTATIVVAQPLMMFTSGRAWNHDMPVLALLLAFVALCRAGESPRAGWWLFAAGAMVGLATGIRITAIAALPAVCVSTLLDHGLHQRGRDGRRFENRNLSLALGRQSFLLAGFVVALLPLSLIVLHAPRPFEFDLFRYPLVNLDWRHATELSQPGYVAAKTRFVLARILNQPANLGLLVLFVPAIVKMFTASGRANRFGRELRILSILSAASIVSAIVPTPTFMPYFYAPVPFMILAAVYCAADSKGRELVFWRRSFIWVAIASAPMGLAFYGVAAQRLIEGKCTALTVHDTGIEVAALAKGRPVLTLAPIFAMEGGEKTYAQFVTGPFALRIAPFVTEAEETQDDLPDADDLEEIVRSDPPGLVLIDNEGSSEASLIQYAKRHGTRTAYLNRNANLITASGAPDEEANENWNSISRYLVDKFRHWFVRNHR